MIASVVVTLSPGSAETTVADISTRPGFELGEAVGQRLPITIECNDRGEMEDATRWLQDLVGVMFVDVVFVHFESEANHNSAETNVGEPGSCTMRHDKRNSIRQDGIDEPT